MKILKLLLLTICINSCSSTVRTATDARASLARHTTIALLPVEVDFVLALKQQDALSTEKVDSLKLYTSIALQNYLYHYLFVNGKGTVNIHVQDIDKTNSILNTNGIRFSDVFKGDKATLCKMLGVDAVLSPKIRFYEQLTANVSWLLLNPAAIGLVMLPLTAHRSAEIQFQINDASSEKPLWKLNHQEDYTFFAIDKLLLSQRSNDKEALGPLYFLINDLAKPYLKKDPYKK